MIANFYRDLASTPTLAVPIDEARSRWTDALPRLEAAGVVQTVAAREFDAWPHRCPGCDCELVREGEAMLALCASDHCEPYEVDARRAQVLPERVEAWLAGACGVATIDAGDPITVLGTRRIGAHAVAFVWCRRAARVESVHVERVADDLAPDALVVLVAHRLALRPGRICRRGRTRVFWLGLDDVFDRPELGVLDLSELWLRFDIGTVELLWPRYDLVLESDRAMWAGTWVELARNPLYRVLLDLLLDSADGYVARGDLLPALFPDEFTNRGRTLTDPTKLDRRLRQLVSRVNAHFGAHADGRLLIGNLRARSDVDGGYRIEVARDRIHVSKEVSHV